MDLCFAVELNPEIGIYRRWYEQTALGIVGVRSGKVAAEGRKEIGGE